MGALDCLLLVVAFPLNAILYLLNLLWFCAGSDNTERFSYFNADLDSKTAHQRLTEDADDGDIETLGEMQEVVI